MTSSQEAPPVDLHQLSRNLREQLLDRLEQAGTAFPSAMRDRQQWLLWRLEQPFGKVKPQKVPYWANGKRRGGTKLNPLAQGSEPDRKALVTFEAALMRLRGSMHFAGLGFAFLPGDGLVGVDVDDAIDAETGEVSELCREVIERCNSYTERSASGKGVHVILEGEATTGKDDGIGLEVYHGSQFFVCTAAHWAGTPRELAPLAPEAREWLRATVEQAKEAARAAKRAKAEAEQPAPVPTTTRKPAAGAGFEPGDDFQRVNNAAMSALHAWVPVLFPHAVRSATGYRVRSKALGRELEEDIAIRPDGIVDWGVNDMGDSKEGRRSPIDLFVEWEGLKLRDAMLRLAALLGIEVKKRRLQLVKPAPSERPAPPPAEGDSRPEPPPEEPSAGGPSNRGPTAHEEGEGGGIDRLRKSFALIYGTETVWDGEQRRIMKMASLRLIFGNEDVKAWLRVPRLRRMVLPEHLVFEPGAEVPASHVNLFDGFAMDPIACDDADVKPMLELLWHLCSKTADSNAGIRPVFRQVLCFLALPLQRPGGKLSFALLFHGPQGTGKNLFFDGVRAIYGKYGRMVGQTELEDKFNDWLSAKLLIIGNEVVTRQELYHHKNKLKWLVTEDEIPIRGMMQSVRWESNHANLIFLSNEQQPLALEKDDRRNLVVYTPTARDDDLYRRVANWLKHENGSAKFMHYLLRYDLLDFDEHTKPLMTEAKESLIELGLKPAERFVNEWIGGLLPLPMNPCSAEQLYRVFRKWCDMTGERYPPPQAQFTKTCERHVQELIERDPATQERLPPRLTYKVVALKFDQTSPRKAVRCWLPRGTGPLPGITEGEWAASCVETFELAVSRYGRNRFDSEEAEP